MKLGPDEVAIELWQRVGMPPERIVPLPTSENFWSVGGPGPCGPDSEIYWDWGERARLRRAGLRARLHPLRPVPRVLEPRVHGVRAARRRHGDAAAEAEHRHRASASSAARAILQDVRSVYETDGYQQIMAWIAAESGVAYGDSPAATKAHRILADHGRGMTFLVGDGVTPSNEGRGYVLRRIIRRAVQQAQRIGLHDVHRLSAVVVEQMGDAYPELSAAGRRDRARAAARGGAIPRDARARPSKLFEELGSQSVDLRRAGVHARGDIRLPAGAHGRAGGGARSGGRLDGYGVEMERHREVSRAAAGSTELQRAADFARSAGFTTEFVGYAKTDVLTQIGALEALEDGLFLAKLRESPFYPAGGGQVTDAGTIELDDGSGTTAELVEAYRLERRPGAPVSRLRASRPGDRVRARVPWTVRFPTMANHTGTHLLHQALREVLGEHVRQAGSAVRPDKLRFDFTHDRALSAEQRDAVERRVNELVFENRPVHVFETPIDEARRLGATMLFGEKYGDIVRVVEVPGYSVELCGGTHVSSSAEIGPFVLLSESSVGAGVRRVEAVTSGAPGRCSTSARESWTRSARSSRRFARRRRPRPRLGGPTCRSRTCAPRAAST